MNSPLGNIEGPTGLEAVGKDRAWESVTLGKAVAACAVMQWEAKAQCVGTAGVVLGFLRRQQ